MVKLLRILYVSVISSSLKTSGFERLIASARRRNRQLDLTGALLICDGHFVQALEGQAAAVDEMLAKISADSRHDELRVMERVTIDQRMFQDWGMALIDDSRCESHFVDLVRGKTTPGDFLKQLRLWVEEQKEEPR